MNFCKMCPPILGFFTVPAVIKHRQWLHLDNVTACLDSVEDLGDFLELEMVIADASEKEAALNDLIALLEPAMPSILSTGTLVLDDAVLLPAMDAMLPMMVLFVLLCAVLSIPVSYRLRMYCFCLIDAPRGGALRAISTSRRIMRRNCFRLFRLDLSFWWYHGLLAIAGTVQMLPLLGLPLPLSFDAQYYLFYGIYLILVTAVYTLMRNRVETTYAAAYETLREKPEENAVVLGNIFDM
jgi:hypothetical protein